MPHLSDVRITFAPAAGVDFEVVEFTLDEALSQPFVLHVSLSSFDAAVDFGAMLDQPATFTIWRGAQAVRHVHGIVTGFEQGDTGFRRTRYRAVVEPALARTGLCSDWRIFQQQSVPEILKQIIKSHGITDYEQVVTHEHLPREYCVQAGDTDLQFMARLAAEEGFFYRFAHTDKSHRLIHGDRIYVHGEIEGGPVHYNPAAGGDQPAPALHKFVYAEQVRTARQTQRDYTHTHPRYDQEHAPVAADLDHQDTRYERYDYPGRYKHDDAGKPFTQNRLLGLRRDARVAHVEGDDARLVPGVAFDLTGHPREDWNHGWRPVRMRHHGVQHTSQQEEAVGATQGTQYRYSADLVPDKVDWKPEPAPKPRIDGPQHAVVVGPAGEEIYTPVTELGVGQVGIVFLSQAAAPADPTAPRCPPGVVPAVNVDPLRHGTARTVAFNLKADAPISAYSIFPYGGADSVYPASTMLLPVSSWDTSYIAVSTGKFGNPNEGGNLNRRVLQLVANEDDTRITMKPRVDIASGVEVEGAIEGETKTWTLSRGQVLQINQFAPLTGTPIASNKPFGMFGGSPCTFLPIEEASCDLTHQQIAPFVQWGTHYPLVPHRPRVQTTSGPTREVSAWSFVGAADGAVLTYAPAKPAGAPETLAAGQVVEFMTDALVPVRSQDSKHPFYVGAHMTGWRFAGGRPSPSNFLGDPEFVNVVAADQFLERYVFFTDYTYPETTLTIVRRKTAKGFAPVELECAGEITDFEPLGASGEFEFAWVRLTSGYTPQKFPKGECGYGRHEARSTGPFSVTVWGVGDAASYGYTGGMGARPVNDAPPPVVD